MAMLTYSLGRDTVSYWKQVMAMDAWPTGYILSAVGKQISMLVQASLFLLVLQCGNHMRWSCPHSGWVLLFLLSLFGDTLTGVSSSGSKARQVDKEDESSQRHAANWNIVTEALLTKLKLLLKPYSANWNIVAEPLLGKLKHCYWILIWQTETLLLNPLS